MFREVSEGSVSNRSRKLARASVSEYRVYDEAVQRSSQVMPWSRPFEDPIPLPGGRQLVTLEDAAAYIMKLPKAAQDLEEWQTATGCLIGAAEGRDFVMHARIGMQRALNRTGRRARRPAISCLRRGTSSRGRCHACGPAACLRCVLFLLCFHMMGYPVVTYGRSPI
jgi:hypothetical protein